MRQTFPSGRCNRKGKPGEKEKEVSLVASAAFFLVCCLATALYLFISFTANTALGVFIAFGLAMCYNLFALVGLHSIKNQ